MKIGEAGEAFFVFETEGEIPENLITSPILAPYSPPGSTTDLPNTATGRFGAREDGTMPEQEPEFLDLDAGFEYFTRSGTALPHDTVE